MNIQPPSIRAYTFPDAEQDACRRVESALQGISMHVASFSYALHLFDFCEFHIQELRRKRGAERTANAADDSEIAFAISGRFHGERQKFSAWQLIAARDGAMQIFHISRSMHTITQAVPLCRTLGSYIDSGMKTTMKAFRQGQFPDLEGVRWVAAHPADLIYEQQNHKANNIQLSGIEAAPETFMLISDHLNGRTYSGTYGEKVVSYDLSIDSLNKLIATTQNLYKCFEEIDQITFMWNHGQERIKPKERGEKPPPD